MGLYPQIPHGIVAVTIQCNKTISEVYTAHVAPAHMEKTENWFLKRDTKNPNQMVCVSTKGEVTWDIPVDSLPTVEEKQHWDRHPKFVSLQRARDGWTWRTSNVGRLLPNYRDIEVEGEEERLPYLGNSDFYAWQHIPLEDQPFQQLDDQEIPFVPSQLRFEQSEPNLPSAPTGGASRKIRGEIRLPPLPPPPDFPPTEDDGADKSQRMKEEHSPSRTFFHLRGGVLPPTPPLPDEF